MGGLFYGRYYERNRKLGITYKNSGRDRHNGRIDRHSGIVTLFEF